METYKNLQKLTKTEVGRVMPVKFEKQYRIQKAAEALGVSTVTLWMILKPGRSLVPAR